MRRGKNNPVRGLCAGRAGIINFGIGLIVRDSEQSEFVISAEAVEHPPEAVLERTLQGRLAQQRRI